MLHQFSKKYNKKDIALSEDDALAVFKYKNDLQEEKIKKDSQPIFIENDLNIAIKCNVKIVDYLDVIVNLLNIIYKPFSIPNKKTNYIYRESDHSPYTIF